MTDQRENLLSLLNRYVPLDSADQARRDRLLAFVASDPRCFERANNHGHITGSAWVVNQSGLWVLLTHHKKLGKWLQLGGHADGEGNVLSVAMREASEESGLVNLRPVSEEIFDVDVHLIPAFGSEREHYHYDVRFALQVAGSHEFVVGEESHALEWVPVDRIRDFTNEESLLRMAAKWRTLSKSG